MEQRALRLMAAFATIVSASGPASSGDWESSSNAYYTNGFPFNGPNGGSSNFGNNYFNNGPYSSWPPATFDPSEFAASVLGMDPSRAQRFIVIHGVLASIAFVALLPLGAILIRVVPSKSAWLAHAVTQTVGYATYIAAAGIGIYLVSTIRLPFPEPGTSLLELQSINYHFIIGLVVLVVLLFQPLTGVVHHIKYKRNSAAASRRAASAAARTAAAANYDSDRTVTSSSSPSPPPGGSKDEREYNNNGANGSGTYTPRTAWSHVHIWLGRLAITLGIINGGLGLHISGGTTNYIIAYSVIAGVVWLVWLAAVVYGEVSRMKARRAERRKPRDMVVTPGTYTGGNVYGGAFGGGGGGGARQQQQQQPQYPRGDGGESDHRYYVPRYETPASVGAPLAAGRAGGNNRGFPPAQIYEQRQHASQASPEVQQTSFPVSPTSPSLLRQQQQQDQQDSQPWPSSGGPNRNEAVSPLSVYAVRY